MAFNAAKAVEATGPGTYRFLVAQAFLLCLEDRHDDDDFAESVAALERVCAPLIFSQRAWWNENIALNVLDAAGRPLFSKDGRALNKEATIPKDGLLFKFGLLSHLAVSQGVLGPKKVKPEDATELFQAAMAGPSEASAEA